VQSHNVTTQWCFGIESYRIAGFHQAMLASNQVVEKMYDMMILMCSEEYGYLYQ